MVELSKRMQAVAAFVPKGTCVCDVGCDHGFVSIYLVQQKICPRVLAMDVKQGPLQRAVEHIHSCGLSEYIETRLSDGLCAMKNGEAEGAILAGMGGRLVVKILQESLDKIQKMSFLILQPQSELSYVRKWLRAQSLMITDEDMVFEEGKYYPILFLDLQKKKQHPHQIVERKEAEAFQEGQEVEDLFGPCLLAKKHDTLKAYLQFWKQHQQTILLQVAAHPEREKQIKRELDRIEFALNRMKK